MLQFVEVLAGMAEVAAEQVEHVLRQQVAEVAFGQVQGQRGGRVRGGEDVRREQRVFAIAPAVGLFSLSQWIGNSLSLPLRSRCRVRSLSWKPRSLSFCSRVLVAILFGARGSSCRMLR